MNDTFLHIAKFIHYFNSACFLVIALLIFYRSTKGIIKNTAYQRIDQILSYIFIINLYLQLIFGLFLFGNLGLTSGTEFLNSGRDLTERHWPIEHIISMLFALFIANLGLILSYKSETAITKHRRTLIYYSISSVLIILSLATIV